MFGRIALILLCLFILGCQTPAYQEQGWASSIMDSYVGRMTSSGQLYHPGYSTAAHNTLPFGTELTVANLATGRSVQVIVNDRFPRYPGLVIYLSASAAQYIGMHPRQFSPVKLTARTIPPRGYGPPARSYALLPQSTANARPTVLRSNHVPSVPWSSFFRRFRGARTPNAESYHGGNTPPAELPLF